MLLGNAVFEMVSRNSVYEFEILVEYQDGEGLLSMRFQPNEHQNQHFLLENKHAFVGAVS